MFSSELLEIAIGVVFTFLVASLIASAAREVIEALLKTRAIQLERGMRQLLDDPNGTGITKEMYDHALLFSLFAGSYTPEQQLKPFTFGRAEQAVQMPDGGMQMQAPKRVKFFSNLPAYIPSRNFALALLDVVGGGPQAGVLSLQSVEANAMTLPDGRVKQAILVALAEAQGDLDRARTSLEAWFDGTMDRVSGWYKRETQWILLVIGLALAAALNIDIISVAHNLARDNTLRETLVAQIDKDFPELKTKDPTDPGSWNLKDRVADLSGLVGWGGLDGRVAAAQAKARAALSKEAAGRPELTSPAAQADWVARAMPSDAWQTTLVALSGLPGWVLTALAVSLGAPFWFDALSKFMVVRSTVKPYEKSPSEGSQDGGAQSSSQRLEPLNLAPGVPGGAAGEPGAGAPGAGLVASHGAAAGRTPSISLRLAIDMGGLAQGSLVLQADGNTIDVPPDGMVEVPLAIGRNHALAAKAIRGAEAVTWSQSVFATLEMDGKPMHALLAKGATA